MSQERMWWRGIGEVSRGMAPRWERDEGRGLGERRGRGMG